jgi:hypothetical protein
MNKYTDIKTMIKTTANLSKDIYTGGVAIVKAILDANEKRAHNFYSKCETAALALVDVAEAYEEISKPALSVEELTLVFENSTKPKDASALN